MGLSTEEFITQLKKRVEEAEGVLTRAGFTKAGESAAWKPPVNVHATMRYKAEAKINKILLTALSMRDEIEGIDEAVTPLTGLEKNLYRKTLRILTEIEEG